MSAVAIPGAIAARFHREDRVRVRRADVPGHIRTPWYIQGHIGIIERLCGAYPNPEELAYHRSGLPAQPLYRVRFVQARVWQGYTGSPTDTIDIDIYQHWLEPV